MVCQCKILTIFNDGYIINYYASLYSYNDKFKICCLQMYNDWVQNNYNYNPDYINVLFYNNEMIIVNTKDKIKETSIIIDSKVLHIKITNIEFDEMIYNMSINNYSNLQKENLHLQSEIINLKNVNNNIKYKNIHLKNIIDNLQNQIIELKNKCLTDKI